MEQNYCEACGDPAEVSYDKLSTDSLFGGKYEPKFYPARHFCGLCATEKDFHRDCVDIEIELYQIGKGESPESSRAENLEKALTVAKKISIQLEERPYKQKIITKDYVLGLIKDLDSCLHKKIS